MSVEKVNEITMPSVLPFRPPATPASVTTLLSELEEAIDECLDIVPYESNFKNGLMWNRLLHAKMLSAALERRFNQRES